MRCSLVLRPCLSTSRHTVSGRSAPIIVTNALVCSATLLASRGACTLPDLNACCAHDSHSVTCGQREALCAHVLCADLLERLLCVVLSEIHAAGRLPFVQRGVRGKASDVLVFLLTNSAPRHAHALTSVQHSRSELFGSGFCAHRIALAIADDRTRHECGTLVISAAGSSTQRADAWLSVDETCHLCCKSAF